MHEILVHVSIVEFVSMYKYEMIILTLLFLSIIFCVVLNLYPCTTFSEIFTCN